jgi:hypothetical protein
MNISAQNTLIGDELLVSVFAQLPPRSTFRIVDESDIVNAFYDAVKTGRFEKLFENYPFDLDGLEPSSRALSEGLDSLQQARLLGRMNPDLVNYSLSPAIKLRYEKFTKSKVAGLEDELSELARHIKKALDIKEPPQANEPTPTN